MSFIESSKEGHSSGFVALIGRPNVGKSSLLNNFVGEKVAITSPVAQTTRNKLRAVVNTPNAQLIFVDTPGIHKPHHMLGERLVSSARSAISQVDAVLLIFEAFKDPGRGDQFIINLLKNQKCKVIVALNKWDLVDKEKQSKMLNSYSNLFPDSIGPFFPCSAKTGEGCQQLVETLSRFLPAGPELFPPGMITDQPEKIMLAELIREQVLLNTHEEVPHSVAVLVERIEEMPFSKLTKSKKSRTAVLATIIVERKSQKGILIGKSGTMLKMVGQAARFNMQKLIDGPVYLELFVKVIPDWRKRPDRLSELGYEQY